MISKREKREKSEGETETDILKTVSTKHKTDEPLRQRHRDSADNLTWQPYLSGHKPFEQGRGAPDI